MRLRRTSVCLLLIVSLNLISLPSPAEEIGSYDRVLVLQRFLDAVYPELQKKQGLLTLRTIEYHIGGWGLDGEFFECRPGSGVPSGPDPKWVPCSEGVPKVSPLLRFSVGFGTRKFPVIQFGGGGQFVYGKLESFLKLIEEHDWHKEDILRSLEKSDARFGPTHREAFVRIVPEQAIYRFSGCRVDVNRATFLAARYEDELEPPTRETHPLAHWYVPGKKGKRTCSAIFEPFDGRLMRVDASP